LSSGENNGGVEPRLVYPLVFLGAIFLFAFLLVALAYARAGAPVIVGVMFVGVLAIVISVPLYLREYAREREKTK
jgi:hypothetical protein